MAEPADLRTLLIGLGSPHGDDQAGWLVARELRRCGIPAIELRSPIDLLDHLSRLERLLVCDACRGAGPPGSLHQWLWPAPRLAGIHFSGTHDVSLRAALELAAAMAMLPPTVIVWAIEIEQCQPAAEPSQRVQQSAAQLAATIYTQFAAPVSVRRDANSSD